MKKVFIFFTLILISLSAFAQKDDFVGFYKGDIQGLKKLPWYLPSTIYAEVNRADKDYKVRILGNIFSRADNFFIQENLKAENGLISFSGKGSKMDITKASISKDEILLNTVITGSKLNLVLKRYNPPQKTLGEKAPEGAIVLFDNADSSNFEHKNGTPCQWTVKDGAMTVNTKSKKGNLYTKEGFKGAFKLHVEFMCPPDAYHLSGQKKNNSGIYIGDYEVQILDSFGLESLWDDCGSIYRQHPPSVNACLEAGAWQSYDIIFYPALFEGDKVIENPSITVYQNDIKIHDKTSIHTATAGASADPSKYKHPNKALKIMLQEHKNNVQFRNIWLLPLEN